MEFRPGARLNINLVGASNTPAVTIIDLFKPPILANETMDLCDRLLSCLINWNYLGLVILDKYASDILKRIWEPDDNALEPVVMINTINDFGSQSKNCWELPLNSHVTNTPMSTHNLKLFNQLACRGNCALCQGMPLARRSPPAIKLAAQNQKATAAVSNITNTIKAKPGALNNDDTKIKSFDNQTKFLKTDDESGPEDADDHKPDAKKKKSEPKLDANKTKLNITTVLRKRLGSFCSFSRA
ncbi:hypothetical protein DSO57_1007844 [Entomophthora muscae]|uniref:Uncharacterized protein n=1 Tax=Entomophthora muscae TaxID=34485 RepID=A0ACC2RYD7_9FUNG|nr:hypothetical protein DSO57_1007844 [Entomophthora muscae]